MRFNTEFIEFVRQQMYRPGSRGDGILQGIVQYRRVHGLDDNYSADDPWNFDEATLSYELLKLATVFETVQSFKSQSDRDAMVKILKESYPSDEVDRIIEEYFGSKRSTQRDLPKRALSARP